MAFAYLSSAFRNDSEPMAFPSFPSKSVEPNSSNTLLYAALGIFAVFVLQSVISKPKGKRLPGPKGWPLVGHVFMLDDENWLQFTRWKYEYGPIVGLNLAGKTAVVLNTHQAAFDLLDKRASIYSDRPQFIVAGEYLTGGLLLVFRKYGDLWRRMRRAAHEGLYAHAAENYQTLQETEATVLVDGLLKSPNSWDDHLKRTAASQIMAMIYDTLPIKDHEEPIITRMNDLVQRLVKAAYPGEHLVEFFTWMKYLPDFLAPWRPWALEWHRKDSQLFLEYYNEVKDRVLAGDERPSFVSSLVKKADMYKFTERENAWVAGVMISAGAETTAAVMAWFLLAMCLYPDVQAKCQEELDRVSGRNRMPNFGDFEECKYIQATVREILRWRPVDPIGLQHQSIQDDIYEGFFIPKGSIMIANVWAMNRDPEVYGEDFDDFRPDRFLDEDGDLKPTHPLTHGEGHATYGFGRRICVGRYVANKTLFIDIAHLLWACKISKAIGPDGKAMVYDDHANYKEGLVVRPAPFEINLVPRFPESPKIVADAKEALVSAASQR